MPRIKKDGIDGIVSDYYKISLDAIFSGNRSHRFIEPRYLIWYLRKVLLNQASKELEHIYGWDSSTIRWGILQTKSKIKHYQSFRFKVFEIKEQLDNEL